MSGGAWVDSAIRGMSIAAVIVAFRYFGKRFPISRVEIAELDNAPPVSGWWTALAVSMWVMATVAMTFALSSFWRSVNAFWSDAHGESIVTLYPTGAWWYLYSGFTALCASWYIVKPVVRALMSPGRFMVWDYQQSRQAGFDSNRAFRWLGIIVMVPFTALFLPSLGCHTRFTHNGIAIQGYGDLGERFYPHTALASAGVVRGYRDRNGELHDDVHIAIRFSDQRLWSSRDGFRDPEPIRHDLLRLLEQRMENRFRSYEVDSEL